MNVMIHFNMIRRTFTPSADEGNQQFYGRNFAVCYSGAVVRVGAHIDCYMIVDCRRLTSGEQINRLMLLQIKKHTRAYKHTDTTKDSSKYGRRLQKSKLNCSNIGIIGKLKLFFQRNSEQLQMKYICHVYMMVY